MCGKFTQMMSWRGLHDLSDLIGAVAKGGPEETATPMRFAFVVALDDKGKRRTVPMRWGFADGHSKTPLERPRHMHVRAETIDTLPTFADAFAHARGLVMVKTFNIGEDRNGKTIQHTITPRDGKPLALAVIWERWADRNEGELLTFVMATVPANALLAPKTDRMPAIVRPEDWEIWLGETEAPLADVKALLQPYEGDWDMREQSKKGSPAGSVVQDTLF